MDSCFFPSTEPQIAHQEEFGVQYFAQGHVDVQLGGAGTRTSDLPITDQSLVKQGEVMMSAELQTDASLLV